MQSAFNNAVFEKVAAAIERSTGVKDRRISLATRLVEDLALDRFSRLSLATDLKESHNIELSVATLEQCASVADIVSYSSDRYFKDIEYSTAAMAG